MPWVAAIYFSQRPRRQLCRLRKAGTRAWLETLARSVSPIHAMQNETPSIDEVLKAHIGELMSMPGVVGAGIGERQDKPCIRVFVLCRQIGSPRGLPAEIEGYIVEVAETGPFGSLGL
jgi:hypothetical protein